MGQFLGRGVEGSIIVWTYRRDTFLRFREIVSPVLASLIACGPFFRLSASDFLCFAKESHQRKATPEGTAPPLRYGASLRCSPPSFTKMRAPAELAKTGTAGLCSDSPRRHPRRTLRFSASPTGAPKSKNKNQLPHLTVHPVGFDLPVLGPLKRRRGAELRTGAVGEDCLSPDRLHRAGRVPQPPGRSEHRRVFRSEAEERCAGVCFSLPTFSCTSKRK